MRKIAIDQNWYEDYKIKENLANSVQIKRIESAFGSIGQTALLQREKRHAVIMNAIVKSHKQIRHGRIFHFVNLIKA